MDQTTPSPALIDVSPLKEQKRGGGGAAAARRVLAARARARHARATRVLAAPPSPSPRRTPPGLPPQRVKKTHKHFHQPISDPTGGASFTPIPGWMFIGYWFAAAA